EEGGRDGAGLAHDVSPGRAVHCPRLRSSKGDAVRTRSCAVRRDGLLVAYFAYCPPQPLSSPPPSSSVASSAAGGATLPNARATAPRSPRRLKSGRYDGSLNVPSTTSGERSVRMLRSFGRGLSSRSRVS